MRWFWKDGRKSSPELEVIQEIKNQNDLLKEQCNLLSEQVTKLSRLHYKTSKDIQGKVDGVDDAIGSLLKRQEEKDGEKQHRIIQEEAKIEEMVHFLISWLDDLDLASSQIVGEEQDSWKKIFKQWSRGILEQLKSLGVRELEVKGRSFEPTLAESIGTISKKEAEAKYKGVTIKVEIPYQIVEVAKRGFISEKGNLLRKAQVITIDKEGYYAE